MPSFPARLHVLLARRARIGVVIRRGPSRRVATVLWEPDRDRFSLGQWLHGRIYERRSDLSPDGAHLIYFAMNGRWSQRAKGSWTAVSRAPFLKAVAIFPKGDCWHGGGLWTGKRSYWLNDGHGHSILRDTGEVRRDWDYHPEEYFGGECPGVYYLRLLRDGWKLVDRVQVEEWKRRDLFEKRLAHGWRLRKIAHAELDPPDGRGCYWDEHELLNGRSGQAIRGPDWEWAEVDGRRLVWCAGGKLFAGKVRADGLEDARELFDFNPMTFEPVAAPY